MTPVLRMVPAAPSQRAGDADAPSTAIFGASLEELILATAACGLGIEVGAALAVVRATPKELGQLATELRTRGEAVVSAALERYLQPVRGWQLRTRTLPLDRPYIVGILNLTDDSFSGDGVGADVAAALRHAELLRAAGADIIDVGAETARADRPVMDALEEARVVGPVVAALSREGHIVSSDTYKALVARTALVAGAEIINDISGLTLGTGAAQEAVGAGAGYVLNYSYSVPKRRPDSPPHYDDVVAETVAWMDPRIASLEALGLGRAQIAIDPGIAFGKSHDEDIQILRRVGELTTFGQPLLLAHSRKNYIGSIGGQRPAGGGASGGGWPPAARDLETHITSALAYEQGVRLFRVHDVEGTRRALEVADALSNAVAGQFAPDGESWPWREGASAPHMTIAAPDKRAPDGQRW